MTMRSNTTQKNAKFDLSRYEPLQQVPAPNVNLFSGQYGVSGLMTHSLPAVASGYDLYVRMFYRNDGLPRNRHFPPDQLS